MDNNFNQRLKNSTPADEDQDNPQGPNRTRPTKDRRITSTHQWRSLTSPSIQKDSTSNAADENNLPLSSPASEASSLTRNSFLPHSFHDDGIKYKTLQSEIKAKIAAAINGGDSSIATCPCIGEKFIPYINFNFLQ